MLRPGSTNAILLAVLLLLAPPVFSDSLEEGFAAFKQGDKELAHKNWLPLAIRGDVRAQFLLSVLYEQWVERSENQANAKKWLTAAANNGFIPAQFNLGNNYHQGRYGAVDNIKAAYWWQQAAVQGFVDAQYHLATLYYRGDGIQRNLKEAMYWFKRAADNGYPEATEALVEIRGGRLSRQHQGSVAANISYDDPMIISQQPAIPSSSADQHAATNEVAAAAKIGTDSSIGVSVPEAQEKTLPVGQEVAVSPQGGNPPAADRAWVAQQPASNYTIQLVAYGRMRDCDDYVKQLHQRHQLETHAHAFALKGRKLCSVIYGSFEKPSQAKAEQKQLPPKVRQGKPWIRKLGELQDLAI